MKTILFGYDGSPQAIRAMADFAPAAIPTPVEATVLTVADVWMPASPGGFVSKTASAAVAESQRLAAEGARRLKGLFPDWQIHAQTVADSPAWGIVKKAEELNADLIVIGAHAQPLLDRYYFGSIAAEVMFEATCSVRICRPREIENPGLRIIIAVDGSNDSAIAFEEVIKRDWPQATAFKVITSLDSNELDALLGPRFEESVHEHFAGVAESISTLAVELADELRGLGKSAEPVIVQGDPKSQILKIAEEWDADCIFLGARGLRHLASRRLGTVASAVARRAHCSVEICRPKAKR